MSTEGKLSQTEIYELFGDKIPMEAVDIFWNSPGDKTIGEIRTDLRALAVRLKTPVIDTCDFGHRFAKLPDHPQRDGIARCPHCMAIGLDRARIEQMKEITE